MRIVKTTVVLLVGILMFDFATSHAQNDNSMYVSVINDQTVDSYLEKTISINAVDIPFAKALREIADKGNLRLTYQEKDLPEKRITITEKRITVYNALKELLYNDENINIYTSPSRQAVLVSKNAEIKNPNMVSINIDGIVRGVVTDEKTGETLPGANIYIEELERGASTNENGVFEIAGIRAGTYTLAVTFIGYQSHRQSFTVEDNQTTNLKISLKKDLMGLENVVVTGVATGVQRRNLANAVSSVDAEELNQAPSQSVEQSLQGKITGANIQRNSGAPGGGDTSKSPRGVFY